MNYSTDLVNRAKAGDVHAFAQVYETIYQDLYRFALFTLKNSHDAEDAVSDAVTDAFAQIGSLREAQSFGAWMFRILTAKCKNRLRSYTNRPVELSEDLPGKTPDLNMRLDVRKAFFSLSDEERLILSLCLFAGYSSKETADLLQLNDSTVRSRQSRALKKMQEQLSGYEPSKTSVKGGQSSGQKTAERLPE